MNRWWATFLLPAFAALFAVGCGAGGAGYVPAGPGTVSGIVTNTRGGPPVEGAVVTAGATTTTSTTNFQGAYTLSSVNPGSYDLLAAKSGMAASKLQNVMVSAGQTRTANLIMRNVFDPTKPVMAPTISVSGLSQGQTIAGTISFTVNVTASNPVRQIDVRAANLNALPNVQVLDSSTANFTLNTASLANGPGFVDVTVYDLNQNVAEWILGFTVNNSPSGITPATPTGLVLTAITTGQSLSLFAAQRAQRFAGLGITQDPNVLTVNGRSINLLAAPANATLFVEASWIAQVNAIGYRVFRSSSAGGPFIQIAETTGTSYDDADPSLAPGVAVYYQVSTYNVEGQSPPTAAVAVTPLPAFNLNLTSPSNSAAGVPTVPTFTWSPTALVGTDRFYDIVVQGLNDPAPSWITTRLTIINNTSVVYGATSPLTNGKVYQWDIYEAQAQTVYSLNSAAIAIANRALLGGPSGSLNGPFRFTTIL